MQSHSFMDVQVADSTDSAHTGKYKSRGGSLRSDRHDFLGVSIFIRKPIEILSETLKCLQGDSRRASRLPGDEFRIPSVLYQRSAPGFASTCLHLGCYARNFANGLQHAAFACRLSSSRFGRCRSAAADRLVRLLAGYIMQRNEDKYFTLFAKHVEYMLQDARNARNEVPPL